MTQEYIYCNTYLAMDVPTNGYWGAYWLDIGFFDQQIANNLT